MSLRENDSQVISFRASREEVASLDQVALAYGIDRSALLRAWFALALERARLGTERIDPMDVSIGWMLRPKAKTPRNTETAERRAFRVLRQARQMVDAIENQCAGCPRLRGIAAEFQVDQKGRKSS